MRVVRDSRDNWSVKDSLESLGNWTLYSQGRISVNYEVIVSLVIVIEIDIRKIHRNFIAVVQKIIRTNQSPTRLRNTISKGKDIDGEMEHARNGRQINLNTKMINFVGEVFMDVFEKNN